MFYHPLFKPLSQQNQVVPGCEKLSQKRFATKSTCCEFYQPNFRVWRDFLFRVILSNRKSVFTQLATTWFVARQVWTWVVIKRAMLPNKLRVFVAPCTVVQVTFWCLSVWRGLGGRWGKRSKKTSDEKVSGDPRKNKEIPVLLSRCYVAMSLTFWFVELCGVDWEKRKRVYVQGRSNTNLASRLCHWLKKHHSHILTWPQLLKSWIALSTARINSYPVDKY